MKLKNLLALAVLLLPFIQLKAQGLVRGIVSADGEPLIGVTVELKGANQGTTTDLDGSYSISLDEGVHTLMYSYIGFDTKEMEVSVTDGQTTMVGDVIMELGSNELKEVIVTGTYLPSQMRALNLQKAAPGIMNVLASDGIGKLPDRNAAEAVQRIGGVAIERDQGEGRYVLVRGTPVQWNSTLINGDRMPSTSRSNRGVPLDIFPSELIEYVQLSKAITPDIEGDVIGGSVNFITKTSPHKRVLRGALAGGYHGQSQSRIYNGSILYGDRTKDGKFGYLLGGATWNRDWGSDNYELVYDTKVKHAIQQLQLRDYVGNRTTWGFNGAMDYKLGEDSKIYAKGLWSDFSDSEERRRTRFRFGKAASDPSKGRIEHALTHTFYHSRFKGIELGGDFKIADNLKLEAKVSNYNAEFWYDSPVNTGKSGLSLGQPTDSSEDRGYYYSTFVQKNVAFDDMYFDEASGKYYKYFSFDSPNGKGETEIENFQPRVNSKTPIDPAKAFITNAIASGRWIDESDITGKLDLTYDVTNSVILKFGGKYRTKNRTTNRSVTYYRPKDGVKLSMMDFDNEPFPLDGGFLSEINEPYKDYLVNYPTQDASDNIPNRNDFEKEFQSPTHPKRATSSFKAKEDIAAAYAMATVNVTEKVSLIGGFRYENTGINYSSFSVDEDKNVTPINAKRSYGAFLPMAHVKFSPNTNTNFRAAVTRTFIRPDFVSLSPSQSLNLAENTGSVGNPDLNPTFSWNYDLLGEHYFKSVGVISAGIFYKDVKDVIFKSSTQREINGETFKVTTPTNASDAWLMGFEVGLQRRLDFLPGFLSGFGVDANYTFTDSEVQVPGRTEKQTLFGQSKHIYNAALFFEKYGLSTRLAANFKGSYLDELQGSGPDQDRYYDSNLNLDFSASYNVSPKVKVFLEMNNLLNAPLRYYHGDPSRPEQVEWYSIKGQLGVAVNFL